MACAAPVRAQIRRALCVECAEVMEDGCQIETKRVRASGGLKSATHYVDALHGCWREKLSYVHESLLTLHQSTSHTTHKCVPSPHQLAQHIKRLRHAVNHRVAPPDDACRAARKNRGWLSGRRASGIFHDAEVGQFVALLV
eukprot:361927-Chlamydomonas_euryale.AAC.5